MKLKFTRECKDKNSGKAYLKGKTYDFTKERAAEITAVKVDGKAVATEVKPKKATTKKATESKATEKATEVKA